MSNELIVVTGQSIFTSVCQLCMSAISHDLGKRQLIRAAHNCERMAISYDRLQCNESQPPGRARPLWYSENSDSWTRRLL